MSRTCSRLSKKELNMDLQVTQLTVNIDKQPLLQGVNFQAQAGQLVGLVGPSGCGKTTLLNVLGLLLPAASGQIRYGGDDAAKWTSRKISKFWHDQASFVIQDAGIDEDESVLYNVTLRNMLFSRQKPDQSALSALQKVGLCERARDSARVLSGGEQRRLAIARAIYRQSTVIFADEPTASLDEDNRLLVQSLLITEAQRGALVIASTHDLELAKSCTKIIDLSKYR